MLTAEKKKYTDKDYALLDEGAPFQLINFDLIMSPSPVPLHQFILINLCVRIKEYLSSAQNEGVLLVAPMDVELDEGNIFQPDLLYISGDRKANLIKDRIEGAPDLIIEILSPSTAYYDLRQKKDIYEKYGVQEYIIVDPIPQDAELYVLENDRFVLRQKASKHEVLNSVLLPGLDFELSKIFG
ncbi:MAG: Uma2 family endonuclease [Sphingobacteriaceae bacterium]|jgi:Uma2 family endonuclease|nr:Uma2 family endonuclease [Sphingobacteriaceae bacterium]